MITKRAIILITLVGAIALLGLLLTQFSLRRKSCIPKDVAELTKRFQDVGSAMVVNSEASQLFAYFQTNENIDALPYAQESKFPAIRTLGHVFADREWRGDVKAIKIGFGTHRSVNFVYIYPTNMIPAVHASCMKLCSNIVVNP